MTYDTWDRVAELYVCRNVCRKSTQPRRPVVPFGV
jgi:hypothetical protein